MGNLNRLHNCSNPYQGEAKRVLCVCSAGLLRSPTTALILAYEYGHNTRAAGLDEGHALIIVDEVLLAWAGEVVCMDNLQAIKIAQMYTTYNMEPPTIINLNIPDNFGYMVEKLVEIIKTNYLSIQS